jgi:hypothetical protein
MIQRQRPSWADGDFLIVGAFVNLSFLLALAFFAFLREEPSFWTNAGGWPIWLRETVRAVFYPMLLLELLSLMVFSGLCVRPRGPRYRSATVAVVTLPLLWMLYVLVLLIVAVNNLENLIAGQPLHWHPR